MAIDASEITIINEALNLLGQKRTTAAKVASPSAAGYDAIAEIAAESYERHRNAMLRNYQWNFAIVRATLTVDGAAPDWGFSYRYALPAGPTPAKCLRVLEVNQASTDRWKVEGQFILSGVSANLEIKYIGLENDADNMDPLFIEALAMQLAGRWSLALGGEDGGRLRAESNEMLTAVKRIDSVEGIPDRLETNDWIVSPKKDLPLDQRTDNGNRR